MSNRFLFVLLFLLLSACSPVPGPDKSIGGAILGASWGAGAGAVIGNQLNDTGPGAALGSAVGAANGLLTGIGYDVAEGTALRQQRELDSLSVETASNTRSLAMLQDTLDDRESRLGSFPPITNTVYFDTQSASLRSGSAESLEKFVEIIKQNPYIGHLEVFGHTDDMGDAELNKQLSEERARTVSTFLMAHGVSRDSIRAFSYGASRPVSANTTEAGRQMNRRVEIVVAK